MRKRFFAFSLMIILLFSSIVSVSAIDVNDLQSQLNKVNKEMQEAQDTLKKVEKQKKGIMNEKEVLDRQIDVVSYELSQIDLLLAQSEQAIGEKENELLEATINVDEQYEQLKQRIRIMYEEGSTSYVEILLDSESFSDFLSRYEIVKQIMNYDKNLFGELVDDKNNITEAKKLLEEEKAARETLKTQAIVKRRDLNTKMTSRSQMLVRLNREQQAAAAELDKLEATSKKVEEQIRKLQASNNMAYVGGELAWPAPNYSRVSSPYGNRWHPIAKVYKFHTGVDLADNRGNTVVAANDGVVIMAGWNGGYGKCVIIDHGGSTSTLYAHNDTLLVSNGESVKKGQAIAKIGTTGYSTGPHLHFEVRKNGGHTNPLDYYPNR